MNSITRSWGTLSGYSSGSAGGQPLGGETRESVPTPASPKSTLPPSSPVPPLTRAEPLQKPMPGPLPVPEMAEMEAQFKARMDAHAKALEKALSDDFLEKNGRLRRI